jgi:hypothetical protein
MQENWIGKSQGLRCNSASSAVERRDRGVHHPPRHDVRRQLRGHRRRPSGGAADGRKRARARRVHRRVQARRHHRRRAETAEKLGFNTGLSVEHPLTSAWHLPVYVANFVLMEYGTGAIIGCPAHDQRDLDFARKYELPVPAWFQTAKKPAAFRRQRGLYRTGRIVNSDWLDGMDIETAKAAVIARAGHDGWGEGTTVWRLRDWGVSRQRYWGTPIPFIHCDGLRRGAGAQGPAAGGAARGRQLRHSRQPAAAPCRPGSMSIARRAAARPSARPIRSTLSSTARGISCALPASLPTPVRSGGDQAVAAGGTIHRRDRACDPSPALRPVLDPRAGPYRADRRAGALRQPVHARHGDA